MHKKTRFKLLAVLLIMFHVTGCSTMMGRQNELQDVFFDSDIPEVEVNCSGKRITTPGSIPLVQSRSHACTAKKDGYTKQSFKIRSGTSWTGFGHSTAINTALWGWWTWGFGTVIGWLIDFPSGAMKSLKEESKHIEMRTGG